MENGEWRYYYDNDSTPDKGFSVKNMQGRKTHHELYAGKKKFASYDTYKVKGQKVGKDVYEHSKAHLYYKNEPVRDIAKRDAKNVKYIAKNTAKAIKNLPEKQDKKNKKKKGSYWSQVNKKAG